jgi:hypothetical protein
MISELPDHALSSRPSRGKYQIRIATFMVVTAVCAVVLGLVREFGIKGLAVLSGGGAFQVSAAFIFLIVDPSRPAVLARSARGSNRRKVLRLLATFGLSVLIWWLVFFLLVL